MKKLTMAVALQQAKEGKIEFQFDAHIGFNQIRKYGKGRQEIETIEIVADNEHHQNSFHRFADSKAKLNHSLS